jgi:RHH-type rel operon transcriptional repressor/antitoxin RelB
MAKTVSIRLPEDISQELDKVSREINRNKTFIIRSAIEKYLDEYADYQIALDRLRDKDDKIISADEMRGLLGV